MLFAFFVLRVLATEPAMLFHRESVRVVLFVFYAFVISLLAFTADQGYFYPHFGTSIVIIFSYLPLICNQLYQFGKTKSTPETARLANQMYPKPSVFLRRQKIHLRRGGYIITTFFNVVKGFLSFTQKKAQL